LEVARRKSHAQKIRSGKLLSRNNLSNSIARLT
jgi:hypothetical protein